MCFSPSELTLADDTSPLILGANEPAPALDGRPFVILDEGPGSLLPSVFLELLDVELARLLA